MEAGNPGNPDTWKQGDPLAVVAGCWGHFSLAPRLMDTGGQGNPETWEQVAGCLGLVGSSEIAGSTKWSGICTGRPGKLETRRPGSK